MSERPWLIFEPGREVVYDEEKTLLISEAEFKPHPPVPVLHPSYARFLKYAQTPFLVQVCAHAMYIDIHIAP